MLKATRDGFGEAMVQAAEKDKNLMVLSADSVASLRLEEFKKRFPDQYVEMGVSEQNMAGVAAGLAMIGKTVVMAAFAAFNPGRNWEQIRVSICEQNLNVKIVGGHAGLATGADGGTHQALEDVALMTVLPNMKVLVPADYQEAKEAALAMLAVSGPAYLRLSREPTEGVTKAGDRFVLGQARLLEQGSEGTIVATGLMVEVAAAAAKELAAAGTKIRLLNLSTVKPLDEKSILAAAKETGAMVVVEEGQKIGGVGSIIATFLSEKWPTPLEIVAVNDRFGQSGTKEQLFTQYGLTKEAIKKAVKKAQERKCS